MLGRRLLLLAAVLLATGAIAAALTPRELRQGDRETTATTPTVVPPQATGGTGAGAREITRTVDASESRATTVVRARVGDLVQLFVKAPAPDEVELVGLGRFATVDASTPARFEFFAERAGSYPIHLQDADRDVGRLVVERAEPL
jgi:hypothetical protein